MTTNVGRATPNGTYADNRAHRRARASRMGWIRLGDLRPHPVVQREYRESRKNYLVANFELEGIGYIVVSKHGDVYYILDGQHRVAALRELDFDDDTTVQCEVYEDLTEEQEAEIFLRRQDVLAMSAYDKFRQAINAHRHVETEVNRIVQTQGLNITKGRKDGIAAVSALIKAYGRNGGPGLGKVLRIIRDAYGNTGFDSPIIEGLSQFLHRHPVDEDTIIASLKATMGGLGGLLNPAEKMRIATGQPKPQCIAAQLVITYNRDQKQGKKLQPWWKE
jgi:hypothetical protein